MMRITPLLAALLGLLAVAGCVPFDADAQRSSSLAGTSWKLAHFGNGDAPAPSPDVTLVFDASAPRAGGRASVNHFGAAVVQQGSELRFEPITRTMMAGPEPLMSQEERFVAALEKVNGYRLTPDTLTLVDGSGEALLVFAAA